MATTNQSTELSVQDQELIKMLREGSGENNGGAQFLYVPVIEINNKQEEKEIEIDGTKQIVKLAPKKEFYLTVRDNEKKEYVKELYADKFSGVILKVRYFISKKFTGTNDGLPWFSSQEFDSFKDIIRITEEQKVVWSGTYADFKTEYEGKYVLYSLLYVLIGEEVFRVKVKGESKAVIWDYIKKAHEVSGSISAVTTDFSCETVMDKPIKYNNLVLELGAERPNLALVVNKQKELNQALAMNESRPSATVSHVDADVVDADVVIPSTPNETFGN